MAESPLIDSKVSAKLFEVLKSPKLWPAVWSSGVNVRRNALRVSRHLVADAKQRATRIRTAPELTGLEKIASAGILLLQVFDNEEVGPHYLREHYSSVLENLSRNGSIETLMVSGAGHTFGSAWSRQWLSSQLIKTLRESGHPQGASGSALGT